LLEFGFITQAPDSYSEILYLLKPDSNHINPGSKDLYLLKPGSIVLYLLKSGFKVLYLLEHGSETHTPNSDYQ